jgi:hypothetical protein
MLVLKKGMIKTVKRFEKVKLGRYNGMPLSVFFSKKQNN